MKCVAVYINYNAIDCAQPWTEASSAVKVFALHFNMWGSRGVCHCQVLQVVALKEEPLDPTAPRQRVAVEQVLFRGKDAVRAPVRV